MAGIPQMNNILCPSDLSETSMSGVAYAEHVAHRLGGAVHLLHVMDRHERRDDGGALVREELEEQRSSITQATATAHVLSGEFMDAIAEESRKDYAFMVCATHGIRGLRQSLFGPDIIKLVRKVAIPSLVVHKHSPLPNNFGTIVMPVAGHADISQLLDVVCLLAKKFGSTVHIFQVDRPGEQASEELTRNKKLMMDRLAAEGISCLVADEPSRGFSVGFSQSTIAYAQKVGAGCIAIMSVASEEYRYIADAEKERLLTNEPGIPVLCAH
jgi:nucleotide-binding universal stress UspA family protein